jgi:hypothetical protein
MPMALVCQQLARDDQLLHLGGAFVDAQRADLAVQALHRLFADHAQAAPQLHGGVDDLLRAFGGHHLGHRRLARDVAALVALPGGAVGQQRGAVDGGRHLRQLGLRELEVGQHAAEHLARGGALQRLVQRTPAKPSAAAATEVRNTSSVRIAILKPSPRRRCAGWRHAAVGEAQPRQRVRRDDVDALGDLEARACRRRR